MASPCKTSPNGEVLHRPSLYVKGLVTRLVLIGKFWVGYGRLGLVAAAAEGRSWCRGCPGLCDPDFRTARPPGPVLDPSGLGLLGLGRFASASIAQLGFAGSTCAGRID